MSRPNASGKRRRAKIRSFIRFSNNWRHINEFSVTTRVRCYSPLIVKCSTRSFIRPRSAKRKTTNPRDRKNKRTWERTSRVKKLMRYRWLILIVLLVGYALTGVVQIRPGEHGVV